MSFTLIADAESGSELSRRLRSVERFALDCEAAGFHRYSDRLCLVQLTVEDDTYVIDPLAFDPTELLKDVLEDPDVTVVMHGADFDVRLLSRDLGIALAGLFDTQVAAAILGERALGLSSLLEKHLDVTLSKKYQRADWARRPLPEDMLEYAASDTRHLLSLADLLAEKLDAMGRTRWAEQEFRDLEKVRWDEDAEEDPVLRVKGAHELQPRDLTALREALAWRDRIARERDRAPFRVAGDRPLMAAAQRRPDSVGELGDMKGFNQGLIQDEGEALLERLDAVDRLAADELIPYPPRQSNGRGRPPPEVEEMRNRLKSVRNRRADELEMDRGTLLSNAVLLEIAWEGPGSKEELRAVSGVKAWQVEALGDQLINTLKG